MTLDVTDEASWQAAVSATITELSGFDILVNNAGVEITSLVINVEAQDLRRMWDVNVVGAALGMKHAFRAMKPDGAAGKAGALGIALMSFTESIAAGRAFARTDDPPVNGNRELLAIGAANVGGALFGAMPAGGGTRRRRSCAPPAGGRS